MKILLIDDDPMALKLLAHQLAQLGCTEVTLCDRADKAMTILDSMGAAIEMVFCDLQMPDMDGVEFVRHLGHIEYQGSLVLVSGEHGRILQTANKLARAHEMRMLGAFAKPVAVEQLQQVLASHAKRGIPATPMTRHTFTPDDLKRAIAAGELVNHYQPKIDVRSGALVAVEALVRWQHPQFGLIFPDLIIPIAERHGLIDALTHNVLTGALAQARLWRQVGLHLDLAVNVSMDNITALDFPDNVQRLADETGLPLPSLILEVTESRLMQDKRATLDIVTRLRLKRISLSIDDFGTGHSSLAQLRDFPFDELKLDRSFVNGASSDAALRSIIKATIDMAHLLGMTTVAEGVESQADWDLLRALGCDVAQGFFIARAMPGSDLPGWRTSWDLRRHAPTEPPP